MELQCIISVKWTKLAAWLPFTYLLCAVGTQLYLLLRAAVTALQGDEEEGAKEQEYDNDIEKPHNLCEYIVHVVSQ